MDLKRGLRSLVALGGGFVLSFAGLGALWIGLAWRFQWVMFLPFALLSAVMTLTDGRDERSVRFIALGALPVGLLLAMFRDKQDSHVMPMLTVGSWFAGAVTGHCLAARSRRT